MNPEIQIINILKKLIPNFADSTLSIPPSIDMGDYAIPCFSYAKKENKNAIEFANEIKDKIINNNFELIKKVQTKGPYLNIFINRQKFSELVLNEINSKEENYGSEENKNETIVIDYSAPNVAKNMGIHNLRSTIIGQSLYNIYQKLGYKVIGVNHLGDWGTQFGKLIWAVKKWSSEKEIKEKGIIFLNELYVKFHEEYEKTKDESMIEQSRQYFKDIEQGEVKAIKLWKLFIDISLDDYNKIYDRLNVKFDYNTGESFYMPFLDKTIKILEDKKITKLDDGALVVELDEDMPPCLIKKSDGATLYATRDIAAALYRIEKFNPKKILYVTDIAQNLHFKQWFKVIEKLNPDYKDLLEHVNFGRLSFKDSQMSTRKGNIVPLKEVLDKAKQKALELIKEKSTGIKNQDEVAETVGIGAIVFNDLLHDRIHNIIFEWDKILDFQGETAPYILYVYARINSILEKEKPSENVDFEKLTDDLSFSITKKLSAYNDFLIKSKNQNKPSILARYVLELAQSFNTFYVQNKILNQEKEVTNARLFLLKQISTIIKNSMNLLNIKVLKKM